MRANVQPVPAHVPPDQVGTFNLFTGPGMAPEPMGDPHAAIAKLLDGPPVFYAQGNTRNGEGTWIVVRAEDQRNLLRDTDSFSSNRNSFASALGEVWPLIPLEIDPPDHKKWRSMLNPLFAPRRIVDLTPVVRERAVSLIEKLKEKGTSADVMNDFCFPFAVSIFLQYLGINWDRLDEFVAWGMHLLHGNPDERRQAAQDIVSFIDALREERKRNPAEDFMTFVMKSEVDGKHPTDQEVRSITILLFVAGLDTVAAALGFDIYYLARHHDAQELLRSDPERIVLAAEELLRFYPSVTPIRRAVRDVELHGVLIRKGDLVACPSMTANRDPNEFPDPDKVVLDREDNRHVAFSYGPHRCLGSHLARREIVIGIEELLARIPTFSLVPEKAPITHGGFVFGINNLWIDWSDKRSA